MNKPAVKLSADAIEFIAAIIGAIAVIMAIGGLTFDNVPMCIVSLSFAITGIGVLEVADFRHD